MTHRTIIYCRKSTDREDKQQNSLESQINACTRTIENQGLSLIDTLVESRSAKTGGNRPIFEQMIARCKKWGVDFIVVDEPSRLSRNTEDSGRVLGLLESGHIKGIYTSSQKFLWEQATELFMLLLSFGMAKLDNDTRSRNVKARMVTCAEKGKCLWPAPFGYNNVTLVKNGKIIGRGVEISKIEAPIVQEIFQMRAESRMTIPAIAEYCKERYRNMVDFRFSSQSISRMLKQVFYVGMLAYSGKVYQWEHIGIVPTKTFEKVQKVQFWQFEREKTAKAQPLDRPSYLFKGKVFDGEWLALTSELKKKRLVYYRSQGLRSKCTVNISQRLLEEAIAERLSEVLLPPEQYELIAKMTRIVYDTMDSYNKEIETEYRKKLEELKQKQNKLVQAFLNDTLTDDIYKKTNKEIDGEITLLEAKIKELWAKKTIDFDTRLSEMFELLKSLSERFKRGNDSEKSSLLRECEFELFVNDKKELTIKESKLLTTIRHLKFTDGGPGGIRTPEVEDKGFTVLPIWPLWNRPTKKEFWNLRALDFWMESIQDSKIHSKTPILEPPIRLELMTVGLQNRCSTNWAMVARGQIV